MKNFCSKGKKNEIQNLINLKTRNLSSIKFLNLNKIFIKHAH